MDKWREGKDGVRKGRRKRHKVRERGGGSEEGKSMRQGEFRAERGKRK